MDEREKPRYGDPVQSTPDSEDELIDPERIAFAMTPTEDPSGLSRYDAAADGQHRRRDREIR